MIFKKQLLMIEPDYGVDTPIHDEVVEKLKSVWHLKETPMGYMGVHQCKCGAESDNRLWLLNGHETNSLAFHYLIDHRWEVPDEEIAKVLALPPATEVSLYKHNNNLAKDHATVYALERMSEQADISEGLRKLLRTKITGERARLGL